MYGEMLLLEHSFLVPIVCCAAKMELDLFKLLSHSRSLSCKRTNVVLYLVAAAITVSFLILALGILLSFR